MGLDEYSMSASSVLKVRSLMKKLSTEDMKKLADKAVNESESNDDNIKLVEEFTK
jgi:phosphotransferase system enzyme I (PtsI)